MNIKEALLTVMVVFGVGFIIVTLDEIACSAQTRDIGFSNKYSLLTGCMIEHKPNTWIPLKQYRVF